jgi:hypothetical protein
VELSKSQKSEDSDDLGVELVDTSNSNDESEFALSGHVDGTIEFSLMLD